MRNCTDDNRPAATGLPTIQYMLGPEILYSESINHESGNVVLSNYGPADTNSQFGYQLGDVMPNFSISDQNNNPVSLNSITKEITIIDFGAGWCGPCPDHTSNIAGFLTNLDAMGKSYRYVQFMLNTNSNGQTTTLAFANSWVALYNQTYSVLWGSETANQFGNFNTSAVPTFVALGANKEIILIQIGTGDAAIIAAVNGYVPQTAAGLDCSGTDPFDYLKHSWKFVIGDLETVLPVQQLINFPASCGNGIQNGEETDIDCGGSFCPPCLDTDDDGVNDPFDNCILLHNLVQSDIDGNGSEMLANRPYPPIPIFILKKPTAELY